MYQTPREKDSPVPLSCKIGHILEKLENCERAKSHVKNRVGQFSRNKKQLLYRDKLLLGFDLGESNARNID